jgi:heat shock protein HspQ
MIRDNFTHALIETDVQELKKYKAEKNRTNELSELRLEVKSLAECINRLSETVIRLENR